MTLRHLFLHNWRWKLFSLLIASALWFYVRASLPGDVLIRKNPVTGTTTAEMWEEFPIHLLAASQDGTPYAVEPPGASVTLQGSLTALQDFDWKTVRVFVNVTDLIGIGPNSAIEAERHVQVHAPAGVTVARIDPAIVRVRRIVPTGTDKPATPPQP